MRRVAISAVLLGSLALILLPAIAQTQGPAPLPAYTPPASAYAADRTPDGHPNLQGVWRVWNLAKYDIEPHSATPGVPAGLGVIVDPPDGKIPYTPWALAHRNENFANSRTSDPMKSADPLAKCYIPGVPRITYLGWPFQIFQTRDFVGVFYEWHHMERYIPLTNSPRLDPEWEFFSGLPRGRWEEDSLVVDITHFNDHTWLDMAGNFFTRTAHVVERYTRTGPDTLDYQVTIEDPRVYTRPWTMRMAVQRQKDIGLLDYECAALLEESGVPITWPRDWQEKPLEIPGQ